MPTATTCPECSRALTADGRCVNADCPRAQASVSQGAGRMTAKASVAAVSDAPRAWRASGGVD